jgi:hypothetical protein
MDSSHHRAAVPDQGPARTGGAGVDTRQLPCGRVHLWEDDPAARERNYRGALAHLRPPRFWGQRRCASIPGARSRRSPRSSWTTWRRATGSTARSATTMASRLVRKPIGACRCRRQHGGHRRRGGPPAYGILLHIGHWEDGDPDAGDARLARYAVHTHVDAEITRTRLAEKMGLLLEAGYAGCWGVEHHSARTSTPRSPCRSPRSAANWPAPCGASVGPRPVPERGAGSQPAPDRGAGRPRLNETPRRTPAGPSRDEHSRTQPGRSGVA